MSLLEVKDLKFKYTEKELFSNAEFRLNPKEHIVLVGHNGVGKSTFMNIIAKNIVPDMGSVTWQNGVTYSYLDQHLKVSHDIEVSKYLYGVFSELFDKEREMNGYYKELETCSESEYEKYLNRAYSISEYLEEHDFYAINSTVGNIINGLGISEDILKMPLKKISGGQKAKVFLAKMLLEKNDVLLLDEPTNFLDTNHVEWLEGFLNAFEGSFIVITHDKEFAKSISRIVYSLENKQIVKYKGDYEFYLKESVIRHEHYQKQYQNQQKMIKQTEDFIKKNIVRATTSKRAKSRRKMLDHIDVLDKPESNMKISLEFPYSKNLGQEVLKVEELEIGYGKALLPPINLLIKKNQKVAILGKNGVGKSTFLKTILSQIDKISGKYKFNPSADINYFCQEEMPKNINAIEYLRGFYPLKENGELRSVLARLALNSEMVNKPMAQLSGGEQTKVRLALMTMKKSNLLILDEPTNHLDKLAKAKLFEAIEKFPGSVILVSHERDFYDGLVDIELTFE